MAFSRTFRVNVKIGKHPGLQEQIGIGNFRFDESGARGGIDLFGDEINFAIEFFAGISRDADLDLSARLSIG